MSPKFYYVPWEGYAANNEPEGRGKLDRLCLQGPHTLEKAEALAAEIRNSGFLASVVDCSSTLRNATLANEALQALSNIVKSAPLVGLPLALESDIQSAIIVLRKAGKI